MTAYNFKSQFAPLVESGQKTQTIRALGKRRPPAAGEILQLYTGMRTKSCRKLLDAICDEVQKIQIIEGAVHLNGKVLQADEILQLAQDDGFESIADFLLFFKQTHGFPFDGVLIKWRTL